MVSNQVTSVSEVPALARSQLRIGDQLEPEDGDVEVPGPVLVRDRHGEQLKVGEAHAPE
jgi:hypothetical protein